MFMAFVDDVLHLKLTEYLCWLLRRIYATYPGVAGGLLLS
jgi:hypothetical protein